MHMTVMSFDVRSQQAELESADSRVRQLASYWEEKRAGRRAPRRSDIRPEELRVYVGDLSLVDAVQDPLDFRYRLVGTRVEFATGSDMTGHSVREIRPPSYGQSIYDDLVAAYRAGRPILFRVTLVSEELQLAYSRLVMPLLADGVSQDQSRIAHLLTYSLRPPSFRRTFERMLARSAA